MLRGPMLLSDAELITFVNGLGIDEVDLHNLLVLHLNVMLALSTATILCRFVVGYVSGRLYRRLPTPWFIVK
jgi:hypothetical protein